MGKLTYVPATATPQDISDVIKRDGAVVVENVISQQQAQDTLEELKPFVDATPIGRDEFSGVHTTRTGALIARSPASRELTMQDSVLGVCNEFLLPNCKRYQLHLAQVIRLMPGQPKQLLHRDRLAWGEYLQGVEPQLNTIWALTDFTHENGATQVVPGSPDWPGDREATSDEIEYAEMSQGSMLVYSGTVIHGGGENRSSADRAGLNITYSLGWLRQEENQYLSCPPEMAKDFSPELQELLGYTMMNYALGYYTPPVAASEEAGILPPEFALGRKPRKARKFA
jgi:ectoine hydroxylase-related dioxygenase (phytanoyl-CoA dioxygenase family)